MNNIKLLIFTSLIIYFYNITHGNPVAKINPTQTKYTLGKSLITIGRFTYFSPDLNIRQANEGAALTIGQFTSIADKVIIFLGMNHRTDWITTFPFSCLHTKYFKSQDIIGHPATKGGVTIGNDVWIGHGATIMSGVTIGDGAIIGACSVVTKDVEPYAIAAGNPARHIKYRFEQDIREALQELHWWDLEIDQIKEIVHDLCSYPNLEMLQNLLKRYRNK